jgi:hypothetical protein
MAAPGPPPRAEAGPSVVTDVRGSASNEAAAAAELLMLLGNGDGKTAMVTRLGFLQDALFSRGVSEELARREMLELASNNGISPPPSPPSTPTSRPSFVLSAAGRRAASRHASAPVCA